MFKFDKFPAIIRYEASDKDGENLLTRDAKVYGTVCNDQLVVVEELDLTSDVYLLDIDVFNERFQDYVVVKEE